MKSERIWIGLAGAAVLVIGAACWVATGEVTRPTDPRREAAWAKVEPLLEKAEQETDAAIDKAVDRVCEFFTERKKRVPAFAEEVLGLRSKFEFVKGKFGGDHAAYLRERFEQTVFSPAELDAAMRSAVEGFVADLQGIENRLLVAVRADLADGDIPELSAGGRLSGEDAFRAEYAKLAEQASCAMARDLPVAIGREVVSWVGGDIATSVITSLGADVAARFGISGGILGSGVASGVVTLGVGAVAGYAVDRMVGWALKALGYDPEAEVAEKIEEALDVLQDVLMLGEHYEPPVVIENPYQFLLGGETKLRPPAIDIDPTKLGDGLIVRLCKLANSRAELRTAALKRLILEGGVP
jgi:hypothetical protein